MLRPLLTVENGHLLPFTIRGASLPKSQKKYDKLLSIDWLEFSCIRNTNLSEHENNERFFTSVKKSEKLKSFHFSEIIEVYILEDAENPFAILNTKAHVGFIGDNVTIVKIQNKFLYDKDLIRNINIMLSELGLVFKKINRFDVALDFQKMASNLCPQDVLRKIARLEIQKKGNSKNKNRITLNLDKKKQKGEQFSEDITCIWRGRKVNGVMFGSRHSFLYAVMYNKSLEMRTVKQKPWICEKWKKIGFANDIDVYRLEFSIKPSKKSVIDTETGAVLGFDTLDFVEMSNSEILFRTILEDKFSFVVPEAGKRFSRCEPFPLFDFEETHAAHVIQRLSDKTESTNFTKYTIKKAYQRICEAKENSSVQTWEIDSLEMYLSELLERHYLHTWFIGKYPEYEVRELPRKAVDMNAFWLQLDLGKLKQSEILFDYDL